VVPDPGGSISLSLDFRDHAVIAESRDGLRQRFSLEAMSVATFFRQTRELVELVGGTPTIHGKPNEIAGALPFAEDTGERPYDADAVERYHRALLSISDVFATFRTGFIGKVSPVHLFWGSFDLAVTRFSGRPAPEHPGGIPELPDSVTREAYSHEVSSAGFWPGGGGVDEASFYSYAYPAPENFAAAAVEPAAARFDPALGEFLLPYETVRTAADPGATLLEFLQSTYDAAADLGQWDRDKLDCAVGVARRPRPPFDQ
jgi:hypothetical protein